MIAPHPIPAGPATLATPCPSWCNRRHPLDVDADTRLHVGTITTHGIAVTVEQHEEGHRLHLDERDVRDGFTVDGALSLSYALEVAAETVVREAKGAQR